MRKTIIVLLSVASAATLFSCKKDPGKGGKADVHIKVIRGNASIFGATVQVKYGANSFPGATATYDDKAVTDNFAGCTFQDLRRGDYYFYASYTDTVYDTTFYGGVYLRVSDPSEYHTVIDFGEANPY